MTSDQSAHIGSATDYSHLNGRLWGDVVLAQWTGSDEPAVVDDDGILAGAEMIGIAAGAARMFDEAGFGRGDAIPLLMDESRISIALVLGGALTGRPVAPLGTKLSVEDLSVAVRGLSARTMYVSPDKVELASRVADLIGITIVVVDACPPVAEYDWIEFSTDDTVVIVHTSGTTGHPKPVHMRQSNLMHRVLAYASVMGARRGDRFCSASPFYHTAGVAMDVTVLALGMSIIPQDWFSIENWERAGRLGATYMLLVPTHIDMLLGAGALDRANPRILQYGAMPIHPDTLTKAIERLPSTRFLQIFGQTEISPISSMSHDDHLRAVSGRHDLLLSVGRPVFGIEWRVEEPDQDGIGEFTVRALHAFVADDDGWRRTGDLGKMSDEGYLFLHGRKNDRIIRGGENIYPLEIENVLLDHPDVREAAVVGIPDRRYGEVVKAVVVLTETATIDEEGLKSFVSDRLAHFKIPALVEFRAELPRNASGKVIRRDLR